jgi:hypothetical protein
MENSTLDNAGSLYERATDPGSGTFCDARNGLHYMLLRLSLAGLTMDEQEQLLELGARTFSGGDADNVACTDVLWRRRRQRSEQDNQ